MRTDDLSSVQFLPEEPRSRLTAYRPRVLSAEQWEQVGREVVDLVARCQPKRGVEAAVLCSSLCRLLAAFAGEVDRLSVDGLLTQLNAARLIERYEYEGMPDGTRGQHQVRLRRLLRVHANQVAAPGWRREIRGLEPYSDNEIDELLEAVDTEAVPAAVRRVVRSAVVLGVVHGVVLPATATVRRDARGRLQQGQRTLVGVGRFAEALSADAVEGFSTAEWMSARLWLQQHTGAPDLLTQRLRDTWLIRTLQQPDAAPPPVRLMAESGVGRVRLRAIALAAPVVCEADYARLLLGF